MATVSITVNLPEEERQFEVPFNRGADQLHGLIISAMKLNPKWLSMVVVFTNPELGKQQ